MRARPLALVALLTWTGCTESAAHDPSSHDSSTDALSTTASSIGDASTDDSSSADGSTTADDSSAANSTAAEDDSTTEPEVFDYEGEHVVVITDSEEMPCNGTIKHMDDFVGRLSERLGLPPPAGRDRIRYTWMQTLDEVTEVCGLDHLVEGCAKKGQVYSRSMPHAHELVHAVASTIGLPPPFFTEGLAVAHEGYGGWPMPEHLYTDSEVKTLDLIGLSSAELGDVPDGYERAGRFTAYLIDRHGMDAYLALYAALPNNASIGEVDLAFQAILGVTLGQSAADFGAPWTDETSLFDPQLSTCSAPEIEWDGALLEMSAAVVCENANAIGPYDVGKVEQQYTIEIPADGLYELRMAGNEEEATDVPDYLHLDFTLPFIGVSLIPCAVGTSGFMETQVNGTARLRQLKAGRHSLKLLGAQGAYWKHSFTLKRLPDP